MSPTLDRSFVLQLFEHCITVEMCNGIVFNFYLGLPHMYVLHTNNTCIHGNTCMRTCVAVPNRNRMLFCRVFRAHHRVRRTIVLSFHLGRGSYTLRGRIRYSCIYIVHMSLTLSGSSALQSIELGDALEIRNGSE